METLDLLELLQLGPEGLTPAAQDCLEALAQAAEVLRLADREATPSALAAAALQAADEAQAAQDEEEELYEAVQQLEAQARMASEILLGLSALVSRLERGAPALAAQAEAHRAEAAKDAAKVPRYVEQYSQAAARLQAAGYGPEVRHTEIQVLGRERAAAAEQLARVEGELQRYQGLPADLPAARAAHREQRLQLERLQRRLQQGLETLM